MSLSLSLSIYVTSAPANFTPCASNQRIQGECCSIQEEEEEEEELDEEEEDFAAAAATDGWIFGFATCTWITSLILMRTCYMLCLSIGVCMCVCVYVYVCLCV